MNTLLKILCCFPLSRVLRDGLGQSADIILRTNLDLLWLEEVTI